MVRHRREASSVNAALSIWTRALVWMAALLVAVGLSVSASPSECVRPVSVQTAGTPATGAEDLAVRPDLSGLPSAVVEWIAPTSAKMQVRRGIADATFCLPQNVLGILYYGLLQLTGGVAATAEVDGVKVIVTRPLFGVSLGRFLFVGESWLGAAGVRHEYGHTLQSYRHGPFYLLFEGLASLVQAGICLLVPALADSYFERWPENEADRLGGNV